MHAVAKMHNVYKRPIKSILTTHVQLLSLLLFQKAASVSAFFCWHLELNWYFIEGSVLVLVVGKLFSIFSILLIMFL